ncbi:MAG: 23S rRNA (uracil(1939)-C(5))-methyltransferase RlmD [Clostridia bacterium]|nr:23S rRNA (uracil(1939)-C(5))-methyltransferase RlmD [Clostridia bacterium]
MPLIKNDIIDLEITSLSNDGNGVGRSGGMAVFVPFTAVGDVLKVRVVKVCKSYAFGIISEIIKGGAGRIVPDCPIFGKCGGCCFRHISYEAELAAKRGFVEDAMRRIGGIDAEIGEIIPSPAAERYRNKVQYPVIEGENGQLQAGFFAGRSHRVIPCADCLLQPENLNNIANDACEILTKLGVKAYDEASHKGLLRHIYLRDAVTSGEVLLCLVINGKTLPNADKFCEEILRLHSEIKTIVLNINTERTNVITGKKCVTLYGKGSIDDVMSGVPVELNPLSFYQVNTRGANVLYAEAARLASLNGDEVLLDLYCGAGTIGLSMAANCKKLIGVEIIPEAIESARRNASKMGVTHSDFICSDAGTAAKQLAESGLSPDVIILDPPRKGCDEQTITAVVQMHPARIVMVTCNPTTAARDLAALQSNGYTIDAITPVDMFPRTKHVETVVLMSRAKD